MVKEFRFIDKWKVIIYFKFYLIVVRIVINIFKTYSKTGFMKICLEVCRIVWHFMKQKINSLFQ